MNMTNEEILCSFKEAKNPADQVRILAELNDCDVSTIKGVLIAQGVDPRKMPREKKAGIKQKPEKASPAPSIMKVLEQEEKRLLDRKKAISDMIPRLQDEQKIIAAKLDALQTAREVLIEVYGSEEG